MKCFPFGQSRLHSFGVVFVDFDKEYFKNQDFRQNVSNPARCSAFFMYTLFFLKNKTSWRNLGFTVENDVKRSIQTHNACHFGTLNPIFLQDYLFFSKKSVYKKNAKQQAGFEIFCQKS